MTPQKISRHYDRLELRDRHWVYTLVCSCQNLGINTREYLTDVIGRLQAGFPLRRINDLLPDVWQPPSAQEPEAGL